MMAGCFLGSLAEKKFVYRERLDVQKSIDKERKKRTEQNKKEEEEERIQ
jgi:hypothetical protein